MKIFRLTRSRYSPKDSTGARLWGGRWTSPGNAVRYASSTLSLACLEVLVHLRDVGLMPSDFVFCEIDVPENLIRPWTLSAEETQAKLESLVLSREYGDEWYERTRRIEVAAQSAPPEARSYLKRYWAPVQEVPSVIVPREMNYLISTVDPRFEELVWSEPQPFRFDPRLLAAAE